MPAAAVIPAPLAYIKVAAVKKLVVGSRDRVGVFAAVFCGSRRWESSWGVGPAGEVPGHAGVPPRSCSPPLRLSGCPSPDARPGRDHFTLNKSECLKQAPSRSYGSAWNNGRGPASASVGLTEAGNDQEERTGAEVWPGEG